ncbi:MAG: sulfatase-like hydrolase/transferase [Verrucomicrobiota bacterium]
MNLLFIFTDQQQRYALGCMDNPNVDTSNLDRLAARGVLFRRCYSNDPVCGPFRGSLLTGQYTSRCGVKNNSDPLPAGVTTFADAFNGAGYATSWVGKWHLGGNGNGPIARELQGGFQRFTGYQCYNGFYKDVCFYDKDGNEHRFDNHRTDVTTDLAIKELDELANRDQPFMLMMSYQAPHYPEQPAPEYLQLYADRRIARRPNCIEDINPFTPTYSPPSPRPFENDPDFRRYGNNLDEYIRLYNAMCTQIDANIGRLIEKLEHLDIADRTMIVFTSDHGDMQGSHGLKNKCLPHEESAGIPLIVQVPGLPGGRVTDGLVSGIDLMPTCLDLAEIDPLGSVDGQSIAPYLRGETETTCDAVFSERGDWCMIVRDGWKLAAERQDDGLAPILMTHLDEDPFELQNRVEDPSVTGLRKELLGQLAIWDNDVRNSG